MKIDKYFHLYGRKDDIVFEEISVPERRKKGHWIYRPGLHATDTSTRTYAYPSCSECGREHPVVNFCPNCGADMREGAEQDAVD